MAAKSGPGWKAGSFILVVVGVVALNGCAFLSSDGPTRDSIKSNTAEATSDPGVNKDPYLLVTITSEIIRTMQTREATSSDSGLATLAGPKSNNPKLENLLKVTGIGGLPLPVRQTIAVGDVLNVTIYESGGGLFGPLTPSGASGGAGSGSLPPQVIDESGQITVPYAGRVQAVGRTSYEMEQEIVSKLKGKTIDPQVIVTLAARKGGDVVTITGDVKLPTLLPVGMGGIRLLDAVTAAGGSLGRPNESNVTVIRGGQARSESLSDVMGTISKNIILQPGDTIIVRSNPWNYLAFGAIGRTGSFPFGKPDLSLAEALATAGGASDDRATPIAYLYRLESNSFVRQMGLSPVKTPTDSTPVIYQLDLRTPQGFFLAQRFSVRNKDILYFSNSDSVSVLKLFNVINALTAPGRTGISTAAGVNNAFN